VEGAQAARLYERPHRALTLSLLASFRAKRSSSAAVILITKPADLGLLRELSNSR
jgi:hypothetical protein